MFSLTFNKGGAIEFGKTLIELGRKACSFQNEFVPPPFTGFGQYYPCPPPAYTPPSNYGFVQTHEAFTAPPGKFIYNVDLIL